MNKNHEIGLLRQWRRRAGLRANEADQVLDLPVGSIKKLEALGVRKVPFCILARIIEAYHLSPKDLSPVLFQTINRI